MGKIKCKETSTQNQSSLCDLQNIAIKPNLEQYQSRAVNVREPGKL